MKMKINGFEPTNGFGFSESNSKIWKEIGLIEIGNGFFVIKSSNEKHVYDMSSVREIHLDNQKWNEKCILINHSWNTIGSGGKSIPMTHDYLLRMNFFQYIKFMKIQQMLWIQKEENIRYITNILFLILAAYLTWKGIK